MLILKQKDPSIYSTHLFFLHSCCTCRWYNIIYEVYYEVYDDVKLGGIFFNLLNCGVIIMDEVWVS